MKKFFNTLTATALIAVLVCSLTSCGEKPKTEEPTKLKLEVAGTTTEITHNSVTVNVTMQSDVEGYYCAIGTMEDKAAFEAGTMEGIMTKTVSDTSVQFTDLTPKTEYTVFLQGFKGDEKGSVSTCPATTVEDPDRERDLKISIEVSSVTEESMILKFTYGEDVEKFNYAVGTADDLAAFEDGTLESIRTQDADDKDAVVGGLEKKTQYTIYAQAFGGTQKGAVATAETTTLKITLDVQVVDVTATTAGFIFTPADDTAKYKYTLGVVELFPYFEDGTLTSDIRWEEDMSKPLELTASNLTPGSDYAMLYQPFAENGARGTAAYKDFKTDAE